MARPGDGARGARAHRGPRIAHRGVRGLLHCARLLSLRKHPLRSGEQGWTFVEVLIVIAIILILTGAVGFMAFRYIDKARQVTARSQIETIGLALDAYALDCRQYPTPEQGLDALWARPSTDPIPSGWEGPYVSKKISADPWGHPWDYTVPGPSGLPFGLRSFGADGTEGGEGNDKDIASWES